MWSPREVRPGIWMGFTDNTAGNLALHVGDDPAMVAERRTAVETAVTRKAGESRALDDVATPPFPCALRYMNQVHGADVAVIGAGSGPHGSHGDEVPTADAMVSIPCALPTGPSRVGESAAQGLAVMVADCVPVVLVGDTRDGSPVIAVAHAGRPGVEQDVVGAVVARMRTAGAESIEAWLGPSVCGRCYEVPDSMRSQVAHIVPESYSTTTWGTPALDLPAAVVAQLTRYGATAHLSGVCTMEDPRYYSHRRAQRDGEVEGRFIGFVVAVPEAGH